MLRFPLFLVADGTHGVAALCDCTDDGTPTLRLADGTVCTSLHEAGGAATWQGWRVCVVDDGGRDRRWLRMTELRVPVCDPVPPHRAPLRVATCTRHEKKKKKTTTRQPPSPQQKRPREEGPPPLERRRVDALRARMAETPRGRWTSDFVMDLLREPVAPPRLVAVAADDEDESAALPPKKRLPFVRCTFAVNDDDVTVRLPLTALVHVPGYEDLVQPLLLPTSSKRTTDGAW